MKYQSQKIALAYILVALALFAVQVTMGVVLGYIYVQPNFLAEVLPSDPMAVVVGAGVNTTMETVDLPVPTATSFADQGVDVDEDRLLADYLEALRDGIAALAVGGHAAVADEIAEHCSTLGEEVSVSLPAPASEAGEPGGDVDTTLRGVAVRLDASGGLVVQSAGVERVVNAGDVVHVR